MLLVLALVILTGSTAYSQNAHSASYVIAEQSDAPLRVSIDRKGPGPNSAVVQVTNNGAAPVKGYVLRVRSTERDHVYTVIMVNRFIEPGQSRPGGVSSGLVGSGKPEVAELSLDYVEFADGTKWGPDALGRSKKIGEFVKGFETAKAKLIELLAGREGAEFTKNIEMYGGFTSSEPAKVTPKCGMLFDRGYESVLTVLRRIKGNREAEAKEYARKLEIDQLNANRGDCSNSQ